MMIFCYNSTENIIVFNNITIQNLNYFSLIKESMSNYLLIHFFLYLEMAELVIITLVFYFNPNYVYISNILAFLFIWSSEIYSYGIGKFLSSYNLTNYIGYIIVFIGALIYNELLIIYIWGLEKNTKKEINNRGIESHAQLAAIIENSFSDNNAINEPSKERNSLE